MRCHICEVTEVKWSESHSVVSDSLLSHWLYSPWNSPGQDTGVGSLSLLQGIFPTQVLNPGLLHCRQIPYQLSYQGLPYHYNHLPGWYQYIVHLGLLLINLISWTHNLSSSILYSLLCVPDVLSKKKKRKNAAVSLCSSWNPGILLSTASLPKFPWPIPLRICLESYQKCTCSSFVYHWGNWSLNHWCSLHHLQS